VHKRKTFIAYPPNYRPESDGFSEHSSRLKAKKAALKKGVGAQVHVQVHEHPGTRTPWSSSVLLYCCEVV
jgi:hypothetical protein